MQAYRSFFETEEFQNLAHLPAKVANLAKPAFDSTNSPEILAALATLAAARAETETLDWTDDHAERAAIVEFDAGVPREWAEGYARLDADKPPGDVPLGRWRRFVDDCGLFLDSGWAAKAHALGWGPLDLFGCSRTRPFARIDCAGLVWLLNGDRLIALSSDSAGIECMNGARQTFRRVPSMPDRVLAWEIE